MTGVAPDQALEPLGLVERALAEHQAFGDSTYVLDRLQLSLRHRLGRISPRLPAAAELLAALADADPGTGYPLLAETAVRCAVIHAHIQLQTGAPYGLRLADCEKVLAAAASRLGKGVPGTTFDDGSLQRLGVGWIWSDEHPDDTFGRSFRYLMRHRYDAVPGVPDDHETDMLERGSRLLGELLPVIAPSALRHAHLIAFVPSAGGWKGVASASQFHLGGTVFLGRSPQSAWWVAEHLFHEALHQKLYDFRHAHDLLALDEEENSVTICSPWNSPRLNHANEWDVHRVFAAFHVYVQVALLAIVAEQRAAELEEIYGPFQGMIESRKALDRAHYLGEKLTEVCRGRLGIAGQRMADWLTSALGYLDPAPPPPGATVHLCLDLYQKEANQVAAALAPAGPGGPVAVRNLVPLARAEADDARAVLAAVGADEELRRFDRAVGQYTDEDLGARFPQLRRDITAAFTGIAPDRYRLTETGRDDHLVLEMTQRASTGVYAALAGYPPEVAAAKLRAARLRFKASCEDQAGRLLAVLAGAVPPGGRILEIGTGAGVGTAWIVSGLRGRSDADVVSVEVDGELGDAVRQWPGWPGCVRLVTADVLAVLGELGRFSLVFADAAPVKYGHLESVLDALLPGGLLLVDDLDASPRTLPEQRAQKESVRHALLGHPGLNAVSVDGSTGLVLASRSG